MKYTIKISTHAKSDRKEITTYLAQFSTAAPIKFKRELKKYLGIIGSRPNIFAKHNSNPSYRHIVIFGSYTMFYTVDEESRTVFVYRILHGSQDIPNIL